jgi:acyl carrier protein
VRDFVLAQLRCKQPNIFISAVGNFKDRTLPPALPGLKLASKTRLEKKRGNLLMQEVLNKVQTAFHSAFDVDPRSVTLDTTPDHVPAWDSMGHVTLASSLEQTFGLTFDVVQTKLAKVGDAQVQ